MNILILFDRIKNKIIKKYREKIFYLRTGYKVNLVGEIILINTNLKIGKNVTIYPYVQFFGDGVIEIGDNVDIGTGTIIYSSKRGGVVIGKNTLIAAQTYIIDCDHGTEKDQIIQAQENVIERVYIGEDVWLGANVSVLKGAYIEDGAVIGAKSLVKGRINKYTIAVGIPAREIKKRK